jgi:hypothetical protein
MKLATTIRGSMRKLSLAALTAGVIALAPVTAAYAQSADSAGISREYLIKAALLYNFAKFAEWPEAAFTNNAAAVRICVIGDDPFGAALDSINGKTVKDRNLIAAHIARIEDAAACHILFVSASEGHRLEAILDAVSGLPILTVADIGQFASSGGIVALKTAEDRSRLEINVGAAKKAGVRLSSKLLRLADTVSTQTAQVPVAPK